MNIEFYHIHDSTFMLIIEAIRGKLYTNHSKISKMHNVNIHVFTSTGTPGVQPIRFFILLVLLPVFKSFRILKYV